MTTAKVTTKSFEAIHDDYAFFEDHSTEAAADIRGYLPYLREVAATTPSIRWLDFGCGPGNFTAQLFNQAQLPPERLQLTLVEPDAGYLQQAAERLQEYTSNPLHAWSSLAAEGRPSFDLILSNHVLYYVPDLRETVAAILQALAKPGIFLASMAGFSNGLTQVWAACFARLGLPIPHYTAEDLERVLAEMETPYQTQQIEYELVFPDSEAHRLHILRFLLGPYLNEVLQQEMLAFFDPYKQGDLIVMHTAHEQYIVKSD